MLFYLCPWDGYHDFITKEVVSEKSDHPPKTLSNVKTSNLKNEKRHAKNKIDGTILSMLIENKQNDKKSSITPERLLASNLILMSRLWKAKKLNEEYRLKLKDKRNHQAEATSPAHGDWADIEIMVN